jgi:oxygen-independent coproporphyrinogen-3 oxidase
MMNSLYIHIPFCEKKCIYCDFYSIENRSGVPRFLDALRQEIGMSAGYGKSNTFQTAFFGGGTPSLLTPHQLETILVQLGSVFTIDPGAEITVETNPGTVDLATLKAFRSLGVNRLSIGMQSFYEDELAFLGRIHDGTQAVRCFEMARSAGFDNVSVDLIYSLPGQTRARWKENLRKALALQPDHISAYGLIVEDHTPLARMVAARQVSPNPAEAEAELYELTMAMLDAHGYEHYEVSNYARPGFRSRHNDNYWHHGRYLGFGPSAHSFWKDDAMPDGRRWWNVANLSTYCARLGEGMLPCSSDESLTPGQLLTERIFLGLRSDGLDLRTLSSGYNGSVQDHHREIIRQLVEDRLATVSQDRLQLTSRGYLLCDEICERLIL